MGRHRSSTNLGTISRAATHDQDAGTEPDRFAVRLKGLTDAEKCQKLSSLAIACMRKEGYEPDEDLRREYGRAIKTCIALGKDNRWLIDVTRRTVAMDVERWRKEAPAAPAAPPVDPWAPAVVPTVPDADPWAVAA